jgi:hypothetical protein
MLSVLEYTYIESSLTIGLHFMDEPDNPDPASVRAVVLPEPADLPENQDLRAEPVRGPHEGLLHHKHQWTSVPPKKQFSQTSKRFIVQTKRSNDLE